MPSLGVMQAGHAVLRGDASDSFTVARVVSVTGLSLGDSCKTLLSPEVVRSSNQKEGIAIEPAAWCRMRRRRIPMMCADAYVQPLATQPYPDE